MSKCLKCGKIYQDQTLFFCLEDGEKLVPHEMIFPHPISTVIVNPNTSPVMPAKEVKSNLSFYLRWTVVAVLLFIAAVAGLIFISLQLTPSPNINYSIPKKATNIEVGNSTAINENKKVVTNANQCETDSIRYDIEDTINTLEFQTGSTKLIEESIGNLGGAAENIKMLPDKCILEITVQTVGIRSPDSRKNFDRGQLTKSRADEIKNWLVKYGVKTDRIKTVGYVKYQQSADNSPSEGEAENYQILLKIQSSETIQNEPKCSSTVANC